MFVANPFGNNALQAEGVLTTTRAPYSIYYGVGPGSHHTNRSLHVNPATGTASITKNKYFDEQGLTFRSTMGLRCQILSYRVNLCITKRLHSLHYYYFPVPQDG